ncbi:hypothetical protein Tco_0611693 [Tanacetum coccineum]
MRAEYNIKEKRQLRSVVDEQTKLLKVRDGEIENLKVQLLLKEAEAAEAIRLRAEASKFEAIEKSLRYKVRILKDHNTTLEKEKSELDVKVADLVASVKVREQEVADLDAMVIFVNSQNDNLVNHGPHISSLQDLQSVNFSLLADLKSNKDASLETLMDILRLDEPLAERLGLNESQPHVDQLMVPENIANNRPALRDVFVPLAEPLSIVALEGTRGTFGTTPDTTTALSTTYMSASSIPLIFTDDYMVVHADSQEGTGAAGQTGAGADVNPFPNIEDAELDIS